MRRGKGKLTFNHFYCINCGNKVLDLPRPIGHQKEKFHRKKLYCVHCNAEINTIECRNDAEIWEFKENFNNGIYKDEAKESIIKGSNIDE